MTEKYVLRALMMWSLRGLIIGSSKREIDIDYEQQLCAGNCLLILGLEQGEVDKRLVNIRNK